MNVSAFFEPVDFNLLEIAPSEKDPQRLINQVQFNLTQEEIDLSDVKIAILGIPESRNSFENNASYLAPDEIRRQFYRLFCWEKSINIVDFGNLTRGNTVEDTYVILAEIVAFLIDSKVIPILLGGSNDLAFACYRAYEQLQQLVDIVSVDACFDLGNEELPLKSNAYLDKIILRQPNFLFNYTNIGYQTYMNSRQSIEMMEKLSFDVYRVGLARQDMEEVEPVLRGANMLSFDISSVRRPDAPGNPHGSANGFYGEEICRIAFFAGMADKLSAIGLYEYDPTLDFNNQTSQLLSHFLWYFVEGYLNRRDDLTFKNKKFYIKHVVTISTNPHELVFYCSKKTSRWWVEVPVINIRKNVEQKYYLPCSISDYEQACKDTISERWWKAFHKLNR